MLKDFREFALKGNVVDLAVGVIIGAAFGKIVESMVADIFMPMIGAITGGLDFTSYYTQLTGPVVAAGTPLAAAKTSGAIVAWGNFITLSVNFLIIAFVMFLIIKGMNRIRRSEAAAPTLPPEPSRQEQLLTEIRDALRARG